MGGSLIGKPSVWYIFHGIAGYGIFGRKEYMTKTEQENRRREMFTLIMQYQEGNNNAREFCHQHNLPEHVFYYWLRKYKEAHRPSEKGFLPVEISSPVSSQANDSRGDIQIHYPNGVLVTLDRSVSISRIKALIKTI